MSVAAGRSHAGAEVRTLTNVEKSTAIVKILRSPDTSVNGSTKRSVYVEVTYTSA